MNFVLVYRKSLGGFLQSIFGLQANLVMRQKHLNVLYDFRIRLGCSGN